jgi:hypothetical protein
MKRFALALIVLLSLVFAAPSEAAPVKNGAKCAKQNQTTKVARVTFTCTRFGSSLMWATKNWAPPYTPPAGSSTWYGYSYNLFLQTGSNTLNAYDYDYVFNSTGYATRSKAIYWCDNVFVSSDFFNEYYSLSSYQLNQAVLGCADGVLRRDG